MEPLLLTFVYWLALNVLLGRTGNVIRIESWEGSLEGLGSVPLLVAVLLVVPLLVAVPLVVPLVVVVVPLVVPLVVMTVPLVVVTAGAAPLLLPLLQLAVSSFDLVILTCASFVV